VQEPGTGRPTTGSPPRKGKWRVCPLWKETVALLKQLVADQNHSDAERPVFASPQGQAQTRSGIYKIVRRDTGSLLKPNESRRRI
jgi:integrase